MITQAELKELLDYNPDSGVFTWKVKPAKCIRVGSEAGCLSTTTGYIVIGIKGKLYQAHRLAWLYVYGCWPKHQIDHINHNRSQNAINNLREATHTENQRNRSANKNNSSGCCGVQRYKRTGKWQAYIKPGEKIIHLGYFNKKEDAITARQEADIKYGFHENHGQAK